MEESYVDPVSGRPSDGAKREFEAYEVLNKADTNHIVKMFRTMHKDVGSNTPDFPADGYRMVVERIYVEFVLEVIWRGF